MHALIALAIAATLRHGGVHPVLAATGHCSATVQAEARDGAIIESVATRGRAVPLPRDGDVTASWRMRARGVRVLTFRLA